MNSALNSSPVTTDMPLTFSGSFRKRGLQHTSEENTVGGTTVTVISAYKRLFHPSKQGQAKPGEETGVPSEEMLPRLITEEFQEMQI